MRCVIFTSYLRGDAQKLYDRRDGDIVLCADGGYQIAQNAGITPCLVMGDCDSMAGRYPPENILIRAPKEKDDTDTMLCARYAVELGCDECLIIGGIGGRLDHTAANIQTLAFLREHDINAQLADEYERVFLLKNDKRDITGEQGMIISLFAYGGICRGVSISGVKYPLDKATLTPTFPLGVSNVLTGGVSRISVSEGVLMVIVSSVKP